MRVNGMVTARMAWASSGMPMETSTKAVGKMIKQMASVVTKMRMAPVT